MSHPLTYLPIHQGWGQDLTISPVRSANQMHLLRAEGRQA